MLDVLSHQSGSCHINLIYDEATRRMFALGDRGFAAELVQRELLGVESEVRDDEAVCCSTSRVGLLSLPHRLRRQ